MSCVGACRCALVVGGVIVGVRVWELDVVAGVMYALVVVGAVVSALGVNIEVVVGVVCALVVVDVVVLFHVDFVPFR